MDTNVQEPTQELRPVNQVYNMEQGVSINEFIEIDLDGEVKSFQITVRNGMDVLQTVRQTEVAIQAYRELRKLYPRPNGAVEKPVPPVVEHKPEGHENPDKPKRSYNDPVPQAELPVELSEVTVDVFKADFDFFIVEPKPDRKASVKFFKDGLEFAVGGQINKWKNATVSQFLAPLGDIDPEKAAEHRVRGEVYWVKGAEYTIATGAKKGQKGNYKDIKLVQAVF